MSRAERVAWTLTIALAAYVVPLRITELAAHRAAYIAAQAETDRRPSSLLASRATAHTASLAMDDTDDTD